MSIEYNQKLIPLAKNLRKTATPQENHLWFDFLRSYPVRFQRQKTIDNYIADFYCHKVRLIIELDGSQHYTEQGIDYDEKRTVVLNQHGLKILRFTNLDIGRRFQAVCVQIDETVKQRLMFSD